MRLAVEDLSVVHFRLRGHPTDYSMYGGLALQRSGHTSPVQTEIDHDGRKDTADLTWMSQDSSLLSVLDTNRVTEDGAEAVAITYANATAGWLVKRRLQRGESADWLLKNDAGWLALEVSGTIDGDAAERLREKQQQIARCSLPAVR